MIPGEEAVDESAFDSALDLLRRLNPIDAPLNVKRLCALAPALSENLLESVDQPLTTLHCAKTGKPFLCCDYNRDGETWRSPWSNEFQSGDDGSENKPSAGNQDLGSDDECILPSERLRAMEVCANEAFIVYRNLYFESNATSSVYFWDLDDGFAGCVLLKKSVSPGVKASGSWDSIHVFEVLDRGRSARYKLTSTVILSLNNNRKDLGGMNLAGHMVRQTTQTLPVDSDQSHVVNIGRLVEDMELKMRNLLQEVYFGKAKDITLELHGA